MPKTTPSATKVAAAAVALAAAVAGCGGGQSNSQHVLRTATAYFHAVDAGKQAKACGYVTSSLRARLEQTGTPREPCGGMLAKLTPPHAGVTSFQLHGDTATLTALGRRGSTATISLTRAGGDWKVSAIHPNR
jgi:hypothetical protein